MYRRRSLLIDRAAHWTPHRPYTELEIFIGQLLSNSADNGSNSKTNSTEQVSEYSQTRPSGSITK
ncbi:hypothetical protein BDW66DRAFT_133069 [Aspergillus desertorum]